MGVACARQEEQTELQTKCEIFHDLWMAGRRPEQLGIGGFHLFGLSLDMDFVRFPGLLAGLRADATLAGSGAFRA